MTYLFKLARRLAGVVALGGLSALVSNCSSGSATAIAGSEAPALASLSVSPSTVSVPAGDSVHLIAWGRTAAGDSIPVYPNWLVLGGTVSADGWFKATADGVYEVRATAAGLQDSSAVNVVPAAPPTPPAVTLVTLVANPLTVTLEAGASRQFIVSALWSDGSQTVPPVVWSAAGGSITADGLYTAGGQPGSYRVLCSSPSTGVVDTSTVIVTAAIAAVRVDPDSTNLVTGANASLHLVATMSDSSQRTEVATWTATGGAVSTAGVYTAGPTAGAFEVSGSIDDGAGNVLSATSKVIIVASPATLTALTVTPSQANTATGGTVQYAVAATWSDGSSATPAVTWSATGGTITSGGLFTAGSSAGAYTVTATQQGGSVSAAAAVTIVAPHVTAITVSPKTSVIAAGASAPFTATATWSDGQAHPYVVTWSATGGSISNGGGVYQAGSVAGNFLIIAACTCGVADTAHATVLPPPPVLASLVLTPSAVTLAPSATQQFTVTARWSDTSTTVPALVWTATGGTISASGSFVAGSTPGSYRVIATQSGGTLADTSAVTIAPLPPTLVRLTMTPPTVTLAPSASQQFSVLATWSDSSTTVPAVTWSATGGTVTAAGNYTAGSLAGTYRVIAKQASGSLADTSVITVPPPTLVRLTATPATVTLAPSASQQFSVTAKWSDSSTTVPAVTWTATDGTISATGLFTASVKPGVGVAIASLAGKADTVRITNDGLWGADMESGDLQQWEDNSYQASPCGGQFNSGPHASTVVSALYSHSGKWSASMTIAGTDTAVNGTRMFRWCEPQRNPTLYYSAWFYIPAHLTIAPNGWINIWQYKSRIGADTNDPFFFLEVRNSGPQEMHFALTWWPGLTIEGPAVGQHGEQDWLSNTPIPVGRWFNVQVRYVCAGDFTGSIQVWQDGNQIFNVSGVRTRYPTGDCEWSLNNYGTGISPSPESIYVDDVSIARERIGN